MEPKIAHLQMIQGVIDRLATASFVIRGWCITLVVGVFALAAKDADRQFFIIAYFPLLAFWILDGFYLSRERAFRDLFDEIRRKPDGAGDDFSMTPNYAKGAWACACLSAPSLVFYGVVVVSTIVLMSVLPVG